MPGTVSSSYNPTDINVARTIDAEVFVIVFDELSDKIIGLICLRAVCRFTAFPRQIGPPVNAPVYPLS